MYVYAPISGAAGLKWNFETDYMRDSKWYYCHNLAKLRRESVSLWSHWNEGNGGGPKERKTEDPIFYRDLFSRSGSRESL